MPEIAHDEPAVLDRPLPHHAKLGEGGMGEV